MRLSLGHGYTLVAGRRSIVLRHGGDELPIDVRDLSRLLEYATLIPDGLDIEVDDDTDRPALRLLDGGARR